MASTKENTGAPNAGKTCKFDDYENYFEVTEKLYCEALRKMIPTARYVVYALAVLALCGVGAAYLAAGDVKTGAVWLVVAVAMGIYGFFGVTIRAKGIYKKQIASLADKNGVFWKRTSFSEKKIKVTEPHDSASFSYSDIQTVSETKELYVVAFKSRNLILLKKGCFKNASDDEFILFLKDKCIPSESTEAEGADE